MRPKKHGIPMIVIGIVVALVGAPVALMVGVVVGVVGELRTFHTVDPSGVYTVDQGRTYELYADLGPAANRPSTPPKITCSVTSGDAAVEVTPPTYGPVLFTRGGRAYATEGSFDGPRDGPVHIVCGDHRIALDAQYESIEREWQSITEGANLGVAIALGVFCLGIVLIVVGSVLLHRSREAIAAFDREAYRKYYGRW